MLRRRVGVSLSEPEIETESEVEEPSIKLTEGIHESLIC